MSSSKSKLEYVFGCRSIESKYSWDKSIVVLKARNSDNIISAFFENRMDFIGHPKTYEEALNKYLEYKNIKGWIPMDIDDLVNTAIDREQIDKDTILIPYENK